jgi:glyoxylase-like metal-dependent hydrolase (beta-lactamase superfamily II)
MNRVVLATILGFLALAAGAFPQSGVLTSNQPPAGTTRNGKAFRFNKVKEGIYQAIGTGVMAVVGNSAVIINDSDVVIVDDHVSPAAAWALVEEIKELTDKPVRYVINTHFHYDHAHGNQIFGFGVDIIGHEFTREMLLGKATQMPLYQSYVNGLPGQIQNLKNRLSAEQDPARRTTLQNQLQSAENNLASQKELRATAPNVTLRTQMTLHRGSREIQIRYLGRAHTAGDVVVYLPQEKIVITGDMMVTGLSNMSDGYLNEWAATLDELKKLDFDTIVPGHGEAFTDKARIDYYQAYLRDAWTQLSEMKRQGVPAEEAAKRADLTKHRERFPSIQGPGVPLLAATRAYEVLDAERR